MTKHISILTGLKNNLDYTKLFYSSTRALYPDVELVFVSHNSTDGTHDWLDSLNDPHLVYEYGTVDKTFSDTFNRCAELASRDYVLFAHNDMVLSPCFLENVANVISERRVVIYSTIEPPIFSDHERDGKVIRDFGLDVESVDVDGIYAFSKDYQVKLKVSALKTEQGSFFMCLHRATLLGIGGMDPLFNPMFREDDDLLIRLKLLGLDIHIALNALCYHFVSKTSRFSEEYEQRTSAIETNSHRNFIRKWRFSNTSSVQKSYDIGFVLRHATPELIHEIEPWCTCIYVDTGNSEYILAEQLNTRMDLGERVKDISFIAEHDIIVYADGDRSAAKVLAKVGRLNEVVFKRIRRKHAFFTGITDQIKNIFAPLRIAIHKERSHELELINRNTYDEVS